MSTCEAPSEGLLGAFRELGTGTAFAPHPKDHRCGLFERLGSVPVLLVVLARDRAALMVVNVGKSQLRRLSPARQIAWNQEQDLVAALKKEKAALPSLMWVVGVVSLSWQVQHGKGKARSLSEFEGEDAVDLLHRNPERVLGKVIPGLAYGLVEHPLLERSLAFGCRDAEVQMFWESVAAAGLQSASIRIGMASLVESWFHQNPQAPFQEDVLFCDGLGLLLLPAAEGDLILPAAGPDGLCAPRHISNRPNDLLQDMVRLLGDQRRERLRFVGPPEFAERLAEHAEHAGYELIVDSMGAGDLGLLPLQECQRHELQPDARPRRQALSARHQGWTRASLSVVVLCVLMVIAGLLLGHAYANRAEQTEADSAALAAEGAKEQMEQQLMESQLARALVLRQWLETHPHAQSFLTSFLKSLPTTVTLVKVSFQLDESGRQMSLEFSLKGSEAALAQASRNVEEDLVSLGFRIGERQPVLSQPQTAVYHWRLLMPSGRESVL